MFPHERAIDGIDAAKTYCFDRDSEVDAERNDGATLFAPRPMRPWREVSQTCKGDGDCKSDTCAYGTTHQRVCCAAKDQYFTSGFPLSYWCKDSPLHAPCWKDDAQCASKAEPDYRTALAKNWHDNEIKADQYERGLYCRRNNPEVLPWAADDAPYAPYPWDRWKDLWQYTCERKIAYGQRCNPGKTWGKNDAQCANAGAVCRRPRADGSDGHGRLAAGWSFCLYAVNVCKMNPEVCSEMLKGASELRG